MLIKGLYALMLIILIYLPGIANASCIEVLKCDSKSNCSKVETCNGPFDHGHHILTACAYDTSIIQIYSKFRCETFIYGVLHGAQVVFLTYPKSRFLCRPTGGITLDITLGEVRDIVVKWLEEHPYELHEDGPTSILKALREVYPCK